MSITPSPDARKLYGKMVARAEGEDVLPLESTIRMCIDLHRSGRDAEQTQEVSELIAENWIRQTDELGWDLNPAIARQGT